MIITPFSGPSFDTNTRQQIPLPNDTSGWNGNGPPMTLMDGMNPPQGMAAPSPDVWQGINPQLAQLYQQHGIMNPGARGAGFTDAAYWNDKPDQWNRLAADLEGHGSDTPGPGDVGNTSGQGNQQPQWAGNFMQLLQGLLGGGSGQNQNTGAQPYNPHYQGANKNYATTMAPTSTNGTLIGTQFSAGAPSNSNITTGNPAPQGMTGGFQNNQNTWMNAWRRSPFTQNSMGMAAPSFANMANNINNQTNQKPNAQSYSSTTGQTY